MSDDPQIFGFDLPSARRLEPPDRPKGWVGDVGNFRDASPVRLEVARQHWHQADHRDFEHVGGRLWRDKASGAILEQALGNPMLGGDVENPITCFIVVDGVIVFLQPQGSDAPVTKRFGSIGGRKARPDEPRPKSLEETLAKAGVMPIP